VGDHKVADAVIGQRVRHAAEGRRPRRRADQVLQDQVPADEKRHALAHRHVAVGVGRARRLGHAHAELGVTHSWSRVHTHGDQWVSRTLNHMSMTKLFFFYLNVDMKKR